MSSVNMIAATEGQKVEMKRAKDYFPPIGIFLLALFVRIIYNLTVARGYIIKEDAALYNTIAHNLINEHCFCLYTSVPNVSRAPLWPFIMAIIYSLTGPQDIYARLFYCFLGSGTCVIIYLFAKDLFGKRIALFTGVVASVYTGLFIYDGWLYTESLYTFCLTAFTYSLYRLQQPIQPASPLVEKRFWRWLRQAAQRRWIISGGIFLGLAALARPNGSILFAVLCVWAIVVIVAKILPWQTAAQSVLVIAIIATTMIAPWTYRNYRVTHTFVPVAIGMGDLLLGAYNDTVLEDSSIGRGLWVSPTRVRPPVNSRGHDAYGYTPENDKTDTEHALYWMRTHVGAMPYLLGLHFINMWTPYTFEPSLPVIQFPDRLSSRIVWYMMRTQPIPIFLLAACGLLLTWKRWKKHLFVVYPVIALTMLENLIFYGNMRFRAPIEPLIVLLVGGAMWWLGFTLPTILRFSPQSFLPLDRKRFPRAHCTVRQEPELPR